MSRLRPGAVPACGMSLVLLAAALAGPAAASAPPAAGLAHPRCHHDVGPGGSALLAHAMDPTSALLGGVDVGGPSPGPNPWLTWIAGFVPIVAGLVAACLGSAFQPCHHVALC